MIKPAAADDHETMSVNESSSSNICDALTDVQFLPVSISAAVESQWSKVSVV